ncbi:MAG: RNA-directed DNA polymerase, partial [Coriobacteriales bacterium]|nr:RNA-directed DNA polymerase [Coriobacteriales bacterium]
RCVQKCLVQNCLRPLVIPKLISDTYATLPGKGTEAALSKLREHLRWYYARNGRDGCVLTMDYHDYFASIPHGRLMDMYSRLGMDERLLGLAGYFVGCFDGDSGLGLGSEISQISAVFYTNPIDHLAKDRLGIHCYGRYMDDSYLIADRPTCEAALAAITEMSADMGLQLNPKSTRITPLTQGFRYLKKRVMLTDTGRTVMRIQRDNIRRERQRLVRNEMMVTDGKMTRESADQSWQSWCAYASRYDAHDTLATMEAHRLNATRR